MKPSNNAYAKFRCRSCGRVWNADQVYQDERPTAARWTCGDLMCGGIVDEIHIPTDIKSTSNE